MRYNLPETNTDIFMSRCFQVVIPLVQGGVTYEQDGFFTRTWIEGIRGGNPAWVCMKGEVCYICIY
jgi:hypothetical protein